jgi:hypothetical protein
MPFDRNISDTSIPMNIKDNGKIIKKYSSRKLKTIPNELQEYRGYLTNQQPILDEANYVASRRKDNKISKKEEDFNFIQDLKDKREQAKKNKQVEPSIINFGDANNVSDVLNELFPNKDITPTIQSDLELANLVKLPKGKKKISEELEVADRREIKQDLFGEIGGMINAPKTKAEVEEENAVKIENAILGKVKRNRAKKEVQDLKKQNDINKAFEEARKEVEASNKIGGAILAKVKRNRAKKEVQDDINKAFEEASKEIKKEQSVRTLQRAYRNKKQGQKEFFELTKGEPEMTKRGRPKGSKSKK